MSIGWHLMHKQYELEKYFSSLQFSSFWDFALPPMQYWPSSFSLIALYLNLNHGKNSLFVCHP